MVSKARVNYCDWRGWAFLLSLMVGAFWLSVGIFYFQGEAEANARAVPTSKILQQYVGWNTINDHTYSWSILCFLSMSVVIWLVFKGINSLINSRSFASATDDVLMKIPPCTDEEIIEFNRQLGIVVSADAVAIPPEILMKASVDVLAHDLGALLYLQYAGIDNLTRRGQYTALHNLADILLNCWPNELIEKFVEAMMFEKDYLARSLDAALRRRSLERQVDELQRQIDLLREKELSVTRELSETRSLVNSFSEYNELATGKSAAIKWLKKKWKWLISKLSPKL